MKNKIRCDWANPKNPLYLEYHDQEWGKPVYDDQTLFEFLILEGAQAGLNWETILNKRENYRKAFANFNVEKVARFSEKKVAKLLENPGVVRNRLKVNSAVKNANAFIQIQQEFGCFSDYIWAFVGGRPIVNHYKTLSQIPASTPLSKTISKDLKKRGFTFVGETIVYAFMQAVGMVDDHLESCWVRQKKQEPWVVYMIECNSGALYTGITNNLERRFAEHCAQNHLTAKFLRGKTPLKLVYSEQVIGKSAALKRECEIKKYSKFEKNQLITQYST